MAIAVQFTQSSMTTEQYENGLRSLDEAGEGSPEGRTFHACYGESGALRVFDVWESQESFDRFGEKLMPIAQELGIDLGQPEVAPLENVIEA